MRYILIVFIFCSMSMALQAQENNVLSLGECLRQAEANYPALQNQGLIDEYYNSRKRMLSKNLMPALDFNGKATYQSDVTSITMSIPDEGLPFEFPEISSPEIAKDQYRMSLDITHMIYDGGATKKIKNIEDINSEIESNDLGIRLYKLKEVVKNLYFYTLFYQKAKETLITLKLDLEERERFINAQLSNGLALKTNADVLKAEILNIQQEIVSVDAKLEASLSALGVFMGSTLSASTSLSLPEEPEADYSFENQRIEMKLMSNQQQKAELSKGLVTSGYMPRFMWFGTLGYGRPGLNMLENEFKPFYLVGAGINLKLWDWRKGSLEKEMLGIRTKMIENDKATFNQNLKAGYEELMAQLNKYRTLIKNDEEIISLRSGIAKTYSSQLENGVITSTEYIIEKNAEARARLNLEYHKIGLSKTMIDYVYLVGKL